MRRTDVEDRECVGLGKKGWVGEKRGALGLHLTRNPDYNEKVRPHPSGKCSAPGVTRVLLFLDACSLLL